MVETKQLKTKLCVQYRKGRCSRQNCSFAHGDAELRRFSRSFSGRQDYGVGDLREKIGRRRSPIHRHSPGRDARVSQGYNTPRSYGKSSDREHKKRQFDARNDISRNLRISDGVEDKVNDRKAISSDSKEILDKQLNYVKREIQILEDHKTRLTMYLEEKDQAADTLNSKIQELEMQLCKEKDECERIISTTKKFIEAHNRHARLEKELLRSQARLQKLGDQLRSDVVKPGPSEEDTRINIVNDGEPVANRVTSPQIELQKIASPSKKRQRILITEGDEQLKQATLAEEGIKRKAFRSEKHLRSDVHHGHFYDSKEATVDGNNGWRPMTTESQIKLGNNLLSDIPSGVKFKDSEPGLLYPSTSMAAHVMDEVVDIETDGNFEVAENPSGKVEKGVAGEVYRFPFQLPPPPPLPPNFYLQYPGENENVAVDVDGPGENENVAVDVDGPEEEMVDVDII